MDLSLFQFRLKTLSFFCNFWALWSLLSKPHNVCNINMFLHLSSNPLWSKLFQIWCEVVTAHWMWNILLTRRLKLLKITKALNGGFFWCNVTHLWVLFCAAFGSHAVSQSLNIRQVMAGIRSGTHPALQPTRCPLWLLWFCLFAARLMGTRTWSSSYDHDWMFAVSHDHSNSLSTCAQINYAFREASIWAVESLGCWNILFECDNAECKKMDV